MDSRRFLASLEMTGSLPKPKCHVIPIAVKRNEGSPAGVVAPIREIVSRSFRAYGSAF